jgi:death-on-curing protein
VAIHYLTAGALVRLAALVLGLSDGREALQDASALDAALTRAYSPSLDDDVDVHAAALMHSLLTLRPFTDGNKRIAWLACDGFCTRAGARLTSYTTLDAFELTSDIASGKLTGLGEIAARLRPFRSQVQD